MYRASFIILYKDHHMHVHTGPAVSLKSKVGRLMWMPCESVCLPICISVTYNYIRQTLGQILF